MQHILHQRRFARTRHAGDTNQTRERNRDVDVLQVVLGGEVVSFGTPDELRAGRSLTAEYLSGRKRADAGVAPRPPEAKGPRLSLIHI